MAASAGVYGIFKKLQKRAFTHVWYATPHHHQNNIPAVILNGPGKTEWFTPLLHNQEPLSTPLADPRRARQICRTGTLLSLFLLSPRNQVKWAKPALPFTRAAVVGSGAKVPGGHQLPTIWCPPPPVQQEPWSPWPDSNRARTPFQTCMGRGRVDDLKQVIEGQPRNKQNLSAAWILTQAGSCFRGVKPGSPAETLELGQTRTGNGFGTLKYTGDIMLSDLGTHFPRPGNLLVGSQSRPCCVPG